MGYMVKVFSLSLSLSLSPSLKTGTVRDVEGEISTNYNCTSLVWKNFAVILLCLNVGWGDHLQATAGHVGEWISREGWTALNTKQRSSEME